MSVTPDDVRKAARLSRIKIKDERVEPMAQELNSILNWIEQLNEVDVDGIEPMTTVVETSLPMRKDDITDGNRQEEVLANAPSAADGFFVVPKSVE
ncbi:Asp-tRNA(Asn)/Glu-tRNA(Gln) amidotransferase subunit GatC [Hirschia litorea]|uniref:Aspartyl/glutamyl-tRNA(Asn/Gln) amidotransferase subunit C n=1 Tax=Hirschia litorea TaxID=1199156 RepID=A0ABW2IGE0_9PROT